jgi:GNAT superfamily N-acetyltransferase
MAGAVSPGWQALVGSRVVLRLRTDAGGFRDVLGDLLAADGGRLLVRTRRGEVSVAAADVVAGKPVPPPPTRAAPPHLALSSLGLQAVLARHWVAPETERLGGWLLRAAGGFTNRANSVLPLGPPERAPADAVAAVVAWYEARGLPPCAAAPEPRHDDPDADVLAGAAAAFAAAGFRPLAGAGADVLVAPTAALRSPGLTPPDGLRVVLLDEPDAAWRARYHYRGQPLAEPGLALLRSAPRRVFAAVLSGGDGTGTGTGTGTGEETIAVARCSVASAWAGVTAVEVAPEHRRRGLARLLLAACAEWAWREGAGSTYVQVGETNDAAKRLYLGAGFEPHHSYAYLRPA